MTRKRADLRSGIFFLVGTLLLIELVSGNCAYLHFNAVPDDGSPVQRLDTSAISTVHLEFKGCGRKYFKGGPSKCVGWQDKVRGGLKRAGLVMTDDPATADVSLKLTAYSFSKKDGTVTLWLFVIPQFDDALSSLVGEGDPLRSIEGIRIRVRIADRAGVRETKVYRTYYVDAFASALARDLGKSPMDSRRRVEYGSDHD